MLTSLSQLVGRILALVVIAIAAGGAWVGYRTYYAKDIELRRIDAELAEQRRLAGQLAADVKLKQRQIERLQTAIRLLKVDHRVAFIDVLDQRRKPNGDELETTIAFVEVDDSGRAIDEPRRFTLTGDLVYVEYWVIKFTDALVEQADPLRSASLCLFRRIFGEFQEPRDGFTLDEVGTRPKAYGDGSTMNEFQRELWENFWEYANDPAKAQAAGVRAAHGEAPSTKLVPNKRYKLMLRASGGLSIVPEEAPPPANADST